MLLVVGWRIYNKVSIGGLGLGIMKVKINFAVKINLIIIYIMIMVVFVQAYGRVILAFERYINVLLVRKELSFFKFLLSSIYYNINFENAPLTKTWKFYYQTSISFERKNAINIEIGVLIDHLLGQNKNNDRCYLLRKDAKINHTTLFPSSKILKFC